MKRYALAACVSVLLALAGAGTAAASGGSEAPGLEQVGTQTAEFGEQHAYQENQANVGQYQGNGNLNVAPALALGGDAKTSNHQGNGNEANAVVVQENKAEQEQNADQSQKLDQSGSGCCGKGDKEHGNAGQEGDQKADFGEQKAEQSNTADVVQKQGNGNVNVSPAIAIDKDHGRGGKGCEKSCKGDSDAYTKNAQGNGNEAGAWVAQGNKAEQEQTADQHQKLDQSGSKCCAEHSDYGKSKKSKGCCSGGSQSGEQKADFDDQTAKQHNEASVGQYQGNGNVNIAPAIAIGGDAKTSNSQGNGNEADAVVVQGNRAEQEQTADQSQKLEQSGSACCEKRREPCEKESRNSCGGAEQSGEQKAYFGEQKAEQSNTADVVQKQGNGNVNVSPAVAVDKEYGRGGKGCEKSCKGGSDAYTKNAQGNGNEAGAWVAQGNKAEQEQTADQWQSLEQACREVVRKA